MALPRNMQNTYRRSKWQCRSFFNELFDKCMWSTIGQATNTYAQSKAITLTGNMCSDPTNPNYKKKLSLEYMD